MNEIEKSYKGLLASIFGVAHLKTDDEINRPVPDNYDMTYEEMMMLRDMLKEKEWNKETLQKRHLRLVKPI